MTALKNRVYAFLAQQKEEVTPGSFLPLTDQATEPITERSCGPGPEDRVCADIAIGLRARIEGWSTRPKEKASEERRRK
jgi:hypothetical protein